MAILPLVFLALTAGLLSCAPVESGPRVWIDFPLEGAQFFPETTVTVTCHAFAQAGVAEVQLAVDGEPYRLATPAQAGEQFVEVSMEWLATEPGNYVLSVTAFDVTGAATNPEHVMVTVVGEAPSLMFSPTATPLPPVETPPLTTVTPVAPTSTLPPTATTQSPTATPPPPPPTIVSFGASPSSVSTGECTIVSWAVEGVISAVWFDGDGVGDHDSRQRCPDETTTYTLRAEGPGGQDTATVRVNVTASPTPTPDTQGPAAPGGLNPGGGEEQGCGAVTLRWNPVSDPSGVSTYYVKVEKVSGTYESGAWTTGDTELTIPAAWLECGHQYRWAVRAEDGVGNVGPWSAWAEFSVTIG